MASSGEKSDGAIRTRGDSEQALTEEQEREIWLSASDHIGLFLRWIIENHSEGEEADETDCDEVRAGRMTGAEYLLADCDGKLWEDDIKSSLLPFVAEYYGGSQYLDDYRQCRARGDKTLYGAISGEEDYQLLRKRIDAAYQRYLGKKQ